MRLIRRLLCAFFGHDYFLVQEFGPHSRRLGCRHCDGDWGMNDDARAIVEWGPEFEEMYRSFGHRILKRRANK